MDDLYDGTREERIQRLIKLILALKVVESSSAQVIAEFATPINIPLLSLRCETYKSLDKVDVAYVKINPDIGQMEMLDQDPLHVLLVIDVSGSMSTNVTTADKENDGFTILDIVKHAASTIVESLNGNHTVTLISFSSNAKTIFSDLAMITSDNKKIAHDAIKALRPQGATNLWGGLSRALQSISELKNEDIDRATRMRSEIMIFTDGMSNRNPTQGIMKEFRDYAVENNITDDMFTIRTFGFGYSLDSELLENLAKYGRGTFNFIPDASFVGTIFIHAVADMLSGVPVKNVRLHLVGAKGFRNIHSVEEQNPKDKNYIMGLKAPVVIRRRNKTIMVEIPLGNVGSGQIKDILIKRPAFKRLYVSYINCRTGEKVSLPALAMPTQKYTSDMKTVLACELRTSFCDLLSQVLASARTTNSGYNTSTRIINLKESEKLVHQFTEHWGDVIGEGFENFEISDDDEESASNDLEEQFDIDDLCGDVDEEKNDTKPKPMEEKKVERNVNKRAVLLQQGILSDLKGQVSEAVSREDWFKRWGIYYLRSLRFAHQTQYKNNFKDEGIKQYGGEAFATQVERVNKVFDSLPPPEPSARRYGSTRGASSRTHRVVNMSAYNNSRGPCFGPSTQVLVLDGQEERLVPCSELRRGDMIVTGLTRDVCRIRCVIETFASDYIPVVHFENYNFSITPWHPVNVTGKWSFPAVIADENGNGRLRMVSRVYNFILEKEYSDHTILLDGRYPSVLLGHGLKDDAEVLNHAYFASYDRVAHDLSRMQGWNEGYIKLNALNCIDRNPKSGLVVGLVGPLNVE